MSESETDSDKVRSETVDSERVQLQLEVLAQRLHSASGQSGTELVRIGTLEVEDEVEDEMDGLGEVDRIEYCLK